MADQSLLPFGEAAKGYPSKPKRKSHRNKQVQVSCCTCGKTQMRSPSCVRERNFCSKACWAQAIRSGVIKPTGRPKYRWDDESTALLIAHFSHLPNDDLIALYFPWATRPSIHWKANELGLKKTKEAKRLALADNWKKTGELSKARAKPMPRHACSICGESFRRRHSNRRPDAKLYCSKLCSDRAKSLVRGESHKLYSSVSVICQWCDKAFITKKVHFLNPGRGRFCSKACSGAYSVFTQDGRRSSIEFAVEAELTRRDIGFVPQKKMAHFICDFYVPHLNLVIECDGDYWHSKPEVAERDKRKDAWLTSHGQKIVRLSEHEINKDCAAAVDRALAA